jgi:DUF4097 and DUF4098 domain-containing protein YvlB
MAGYPPPYPGLSPKEQARLARQQARFARDQYKAQARAALLAGKAQRDLYRYQTRGLRRSSILGPVIILAIGIIVLLIRMGRIPGGSFWSWYGHWWPMLLVGAGVVLVVEWAFDQIPREDGTPYVRRGIGGGAIFLLLALALTGAAAHGLGYHRDLLNHFAIDSDSFDEFFGEKHESTQTLEEPLPFGTSLAIDNPHGDVTIVGKSNDDKVHITVNKQVYSSSDSGADHRADLLSPSVRLDGTTLKVNVATVTGASADLDITVPDGGESVITANHGDISVSGMHAPVTLTANHGDVEVNSIIGAVSAHINHRDATFSAHNVTGDVNVHGNAEDLNVTDVTGQVSLDGEFLGDIHIEHVQGQVSFHTSRTQLTVARLIGGLDISPRSDLTGSQIIGPTRLSTRSRNVVFDRIQGDVDVNDSDGSVEITGAPPLGNVNIANRNGEVNVTLPENTGFTIDAQTKGGEIEDDFNLKPATDDNSATVRGSAAGGGPRISIYTTHLDIGIHKAAIAPLEPPLPPAAPKAPTPPAKPPAPTARSKA